MLFQRIVSLAAVAGGAVFASAATAELTWSAFPPLPPAAGQEKQPGVASPFVGVHGNALIVAGGANFPDKMPWEGGAKMWWDDIWVLEKQPDGPARWLTEKSFKLPRRIGYGASVSTPDGVVSAGGSDAERCYADVFLLSWDARTHEVRREALPPMPEPLANMGGALVGHTLYVAGGQHVMKGATASSAFWALDLSRRNRPAEFKWQVLPTWPGPPRVLPVAATQRTARGAEFFLFSGRIPNPGEPTTLLTDAYAFDPKSRMWRTISNVGGGKGICAMAGTSAAAESGEILIFGGDRGQLFLELESHDLAVEALRAKLAAASPEEKTKLERSIEDHLAAKRKIYGAHPGFSREVLSYDPNRDTWRVAAQAPVPLPVTTTAVAWSGEVVIPSGEIRPGVRTRDVLRIGEKQAPAAAKK
jgi:cyclically-permuted mutarotase family protein